MKLRQIIPAILLATMALPAVAQEDDEQRTIFQRDNTKECVPIGFEGTVFMGGGSVDGRPSFDIGVEGGIIIGHGIEFGMFASGFVTEKEADRQLDNEKYQYDCVMGGLMVKPIIAYKSPVHVSIPIKFGVGEVEYSDDAWTSYDYDYDHRHRRAHREDNSVAFVVEPGVRVEFNIVKHFHIAAGVSYKFHMGHDLEYYDTKQSITSSTGLDGLFYGVSFSFGQF